VRWVGSATGTGLPARVLRPPRCPRDHETGDVGGRAWAVRGARVCRVHGGMAPAVRAAADRRWRDVLIFERGVRQRATQLRDEYLARAALRSWWRPWWAVSPPSEGWRSEERGEVSSTWPGSKASRRPRSPSRRNEAACPRSGPGRGPKGGDGKAPGPREENFFAVRRTAYWLVRVRTDGERLLVYTNSGQTRRKEPYAYNAATPADVTPVEVRNA
jgi:hypothetical protein